MNKSVRNGLVAGIIFLILIGGFVLYRNGFFDGGVKKNDWVEISKNNGEQSVVAKDGSFSLKLSEDWFIEAPREDSMSFYPAIKNGNISTSCKIDIVAGESSNDTLEDIKMKAENDDIEGLTVISRSVTDVFLNKIKAVKYVLNAEETGHMVQLFIVKNNHTYRIILYSEISESNVCEGYLNDYVNNLVIK